MTTPTTPYALFEHVPLSECRNVWAYREHWRQRMNERSADTTAMAEIERRYMVRALAAVTAERDALRRELDAMTGEL